MFPSEAKLTSSTSNSRIAVYNLTNSDFSESNLIKVSILLDPRYKDSTFAQWARLEVMTFRSLGTLRCMVESFKHAY